ncbi:FAD-binding oxidoreductase [Rhodobacteraceae bacterium CCMM004]|nr:FAD-binding oxidoreductase [Rhodobacteraceae bacterium CCMM004]
MPDGPPTDRAPASHGGPLPAAADVVVIGGGIAGVTAAWHAAATGHRTVLLEKGRVAGEQSSRNWGWIRQQGRDPAELPLMVEANRLWRELPARAEANLGLHRTGTAYLIRKPADRARYKAWMPHAEAHGLDTRLLTRAETEALIRGGAGRWDGALWTASDMRAEPWVAVPALARAAVRDGVTLRESCAVRALDIAGGKVAGVVTEAGRIAAPRVILAGGAWSGLFLRAHGVTLPQLSVRATVAATEPMAEIFDGQAADDRIAFRRRADGGYTLAASGDHDLFVGPDAVRHLRAFLPQLAADPLGTTFRPAAPRDWPDGWSTPRRWAPDRESPFERMRVLDPSPNPRRLKIIARRFADAFPELGPVRFRRAWAGLIDTMPDLLPVIDRVAGLPGLVVATGLSGHGFGIGPAVGRVAADLALDRAPGHDLAAFRLSRFAAGAPTPSPAHL